MASSKAPMLTAANVLKAVKGVAHDWRELGLWLNIPESTQDDIKQQHSDDRGWLVAIIEYWQKVDPFPTWRRVIHALDKIEEHRTADSIRQYAEPLTDPTLTLHNVTTVVAPVRDWDNLGDCLGVPEAKRTAIDSKYSTDEKKKEALMDYWLRCSPVVFWGKLAGELHYMEEKQSLQLVQRHLKKTSEPTLTLHNLYQALAEVEDWDVLSEQLCVPHSKRDEIKAQYPDRAEAKRQMLHHFLTSHPAPSWRVVFEALYDMGDDDVKYHYILQDVRRRCSRAPGPSSLSPSSSSSDSATCTGTEAALAPDPSLHSPFSSSSDSATCTGTEAALAPGPSSLSPFSSSSVSATCTGTEAALGDGDLLDIKCYLNDLEITHIYNLGLVLGLSQSKVKKMKHSDTFLDDVLAAWLRREDDVEKRGLPSWKTLVGALKHKLLGQTGIASDICRDKGI